MPHLVRMFDSPRGSVIYVIPSGRSSPLSTIQPGNEPAYAKRLKLNSADFQRGGFTEDESMRVLGMLQEGGDLFKSQR